MLRRTFITRLSLAAASASVASLDAWGLPAVAAPAAPPVMFGIDVLAARGFASIRGLRVGLLTHAAGVNCNGVKTIDVLRRAPGVKLVKLFGPEHGIYGDAPANVPVQNVKDRRTGIPVFSLYGATRRPTPAMLEGLDALLIDLQDVGARTYTYVSCMKLALEACYEAGVKVIVLDRPNPQGGLKVDGPGLDKKWMSYVGAFQVPYVHGLTIGELAIAATRTTGWLDISAAARKKSRLEVILAHGWRRSMRWRDTKLRWTATSPLIQYIDAAEGYPITGLGCELDNDFSHGTNTLWPFRFLQYTGKRALALERALRAKHIPGLGFSPMRMRDGTEGVYVSVLDWQKLRPTELNFHMMQLSCAWNKNPRNPFGALPKGRRETLIKHIGSEAFFNDLCKQGAKLDIAAWVARWTREAKVFQDWSKQFWRYPV